MKEIIATVGIPGSGKTYFLDSLSLQGEGYDGARVMRFSLTESRELYTGSMDDPSMDRSILKDWVNEIKKTSKEVKDDENVVFIIDSDNTWKGDRHYLAKTAAEIGADLRLIMFNRSLNNYQCMSNIKKDIADGKQRRTCEIKGVNGKYMNTLPKYSLTYAGLVSMIMKSGTDIVSYFKKFEFGDISKLNVSVDVVDSYGYSPCDGSFVNDTNYQD